MVILLFIRGSHKTHLANITLINLCQYLTLIVNEARYKAQRVKSFCRKEGLCLNKKGKFSGNSLAHLSKYRT